MGLTEDKRYIRIKHAVGKAIADYGLIADGLQYENYPDVRQPALVYHGRSDAVVLLAPWCRLDGPRLRGVLELGASARARELSEDIRAGIVTVEGLRKATGAGSGSCKGKRCTPRIEELLREQAGHGENGRTKD